MTAGCVMRFGPVACVDDQRAAVPLQLLVDGKRWRSDHYNELLRFVQFADWRRTSQAWERLKEELATKTEDEARAAIDAELDGIGFQLHGTQIARFNVEYTDFDRHWRYRTPHVLRHSALTGFLEIVLDDTPEPAAKRVETPT